MWWSVHSLSCTSKIFLVTDVLCISVCKHDFCNKPLSDFSWTWHVSWDYDLPEHQADCSLAFYCLLFTIIPPPIRTCRRKHYVRNGKPILKTNEPMLMPSDISAWSTRQGHETVNLGGQEVKGQGHTRSKRGLTEASFSTSLGRVYVLLLFC